MSLSDKKIEYLEPDFSATTVYQMSLLDGAESVVAALAKLGRHCDWRCELILNQAWGGTEGSERWTFLQFEKDVWLASYKDSLTVKRTSCSEVASKLLTVISLSLKPDVRMPETENAQLSKRSPLEAVDPV